MAARRINLLPPELAARRRVRQTGTAIVAASIALLALLALVFVVQQVRLHGVERSLDRQEDRNTDLQAQVSRLSEFQRLDAELRQKTALLSDLTDSEVRWSVLLADISLVVPSDVWLTTFTGNVSAGESAPGTSLGSIEMAGTTFSHPDVAKWLTRLSGVDAFEFPYLSLSAKAKIGDTNVVNFTSSVQLGDAALRQNQRGAARRR